jgi:hypothetical protein
LNPGDELPVMVELRSPELGNLVLDREQDTVNEDPVSVIFGII